MRRRNFLLGMASAPAVALRAFESSVHGNEPFPAYRIIGNIYYVGAKDITSFLIVSPSGHVLVNSGYEETVPIIQTGLEKLGFRLADIKFLLNGQAHLDHVAGQPLLKRITGAQVVVSQGDEHVVATGGAGDFRFDGKMSWKPCKVDRVVRDGDTLSVEGVTLTAHITPGHTVGCTTWTLPVESEGQQLQAVIVGGTTVFPSDRLVNNAKYPGIAADYARTFRILRSLPCDVFLGAHGVYYGMLEKYDRLKKGIKPNPFVDPDGYRAFVDRSEQSFEEELAKQKGRHGV
jgi:metallo-beta-lactamase class B